MMRLMDLQCLLNRWVRLCMLSMDLALAQNASATMQERIGMVDM